MELRVERIGLMSSLGQHSKHKAKDKIDNIRNKALGNYKESTVFGQLVDFYKNK